MTYPLPRHKSETPNRCTGCRGTNQFGEANDGLPVYPFSGPILRHVGRYVDSNDTGDFRNNLRTIRARAIRVFPAQNRLLIQMGNVAAAYRLDSFFTLALGRQPSSISRGRSVTPDQYTAFDGWFYPESQQSGWTFGSADLQDPMGTKGMPFDYDDRGLLYVAYPAIGWGIAKDEGRNDGSHFTSLVQMTTGTSVIPNSIVAVKVGSRYFAIIAGLSEGAAVFDVSNPTRPLIVGERVGAEYAMRRYDRSDVAQAVAFIDAIGRLSIVSYAEMARGGVTSARFTAAGGAFADVAFDEEGDLWAVENSRDSRLWRFPRANPNAAAPFNPFGANFREVRALAVGAGHIAVVGTDRSVGAKYDVRLCAIEANGPRLLELDGFFRNYYYSGAAGYAAPGQYVLPFDLALVRQGGKTYLMHSASGLGDVYEIANAGSVTVPVDPPVVVTPPTGPDVNALRAQCNATAQTLIAAMERSFVTRDVTTYPEMAAFVLALNELKAAVRK